jgi:hypothetical protein
VTDAIDEFATHESSFRLSTVDLTSFKPGQDFAGDNDMLPLTDSGAPGLSDDDAVDSGSGRPGLHIDTFEVVNQTYYCAFADLLPAGNDLLVMAGNRRDGKAITVDHRRFYLRAITMMTDRRDFAGELLRITHQSVI